MKVCWIFPFTKIWLLPVILFLNSSLLSADTIKLVFSDVEVFPYQMGSGLALSTPPGIAVDIIVKAAKKLGHTVHFVRVPNKRVLLMVQSGRADGAFVFSYKPEREKYGRYPMLDGKPNAELRIASMSYYFYARNNSGMKWDGETLTGQNLRVGANLGYSIVTDLKRMGHQVEEAKTTGQNFSKLKTNRLGVYAAQAITADGFLKYKQDTSIRRLEPAIKTKDYFLMLGHQFYNKNPERSQQLWQEVAKARDYMSSQKSAKYLKN
ncbi:MAG: transporter substrate-binding domain-containing protein [Bermanella sp.]